MRSRLLGVTLAAIALIVAGIPAGAAPGPRLGPRAAQDTGRYVVVMADRPVAGVVAPGELGTASAAAAARDLRRTHERIIAEVGIDPARVTHRYTTSLNGFAAELSATETAELADRPDVLAVLPDVIRVPLTDASPEFLGLTDRYGAHNVGVDGSGVVVAIIDSGIWPEHPSFADDGSYPEAPVVLDDTVRPSCDFGHPSHNAEDAPYACTNKLIGARTMLDTYRSAVGIEDDEFASARDDAGHGTHIASIVAGNAGVAATTFGIDRGDISGIAPRAHVIVYKALGRRGGFTSDLAAAIDQAVADGVDVINYSIGGAATAPAADDLALLFASDAGVHVAVSAGNGGPGSGTILGPAHLPWVTSVGAVTQRRTFEGEVSLGNRIRIRGASLTDGTPGRFEIVDAEDAGDERCRSGELDSSLVEGRIVVCLDAGGDRTEKALSVAEAGGVGMILYEAAEGGVLAADSLVVPTVHITHEDGLTVKDYIDVTRRPPTARLIGGLVGASRTAPSLADFSSRGPNAVADLLKPDLVAPGVQILGASSPSAPASESAPGSSFSARAGTSAAAPHVAGLLALIDQVHPDWSPAAARSALMTTARSLPNEDPLGVGAGMVHPGTPSRAGSSFRPGLVYDAGLTDHMGWLCGAYPSVFADGGATCDNLAAGGVPVETADLNQPSLSVSDVAGSRLVTREVTSVDDRSRTYRARVEEPAGYRITVEPSSLTLGPGESGTFTLRIEPEDAALDVWESGRLTWTDSAGISVSSPITVRAVALDTAASLSVQASAGGASVPVGFGYSGPYTATSHGLVAPRIDTATVEADVDQVFDPSDTTGTWSRSVAIEDVMIWRVQIPAGVVPPTVDLDLYVVDDRGEVVASSTTRGSDETIDLIRPSDGDYRLFVHGWAVPDGPIEVPLRSWTVPGSEGATLRVEKAPEAAVAGTEGAVHVSWVADGSVTELGAVSHGGPAGVLAVTIVEVAPG